MTMRRDLLALSGGGVLAAFLASTANAQDNNIEAGLIREWQDFTMRVERGMKSPA